MKWSSVTGLGLLATAYAAADGCSSSVDGKFEITVARLSKRDIQVRDIQKRGCDDSNALVLTLDGGILKDSKGRTGYIASNHQFQFDAPPQGNALSTSGYSKCSNGSLALASSTVFYQCLSGTFYNLYDSKWAAHCEPVELVTLPCGSANGAPPAAVTQISDGQPQGPPNPPPVTQIGDGQPQAPSGAVSILPVSQISDGQPQAPTGFPSAPVSAPPASAPPASKASTGSAAPVASSSPVVTQIGDGQPQAPAGNSTTAAPPSASSSSVPVNNAVKTGPGAVLALMMVGAAALVL